MNFTFKHIGTPSRIFYPIFFIFSIGYLSTLQYRPYPFYHIVKMIPIICLSIIALINIPARRGKIIFIALLISSVGDFFLSMKGREYFLYGLIAFSIAQIMYITAFISKPKFTRKSFYSLIFIAYALVIGVLMFPSLDRMFIPIAIYFLLLTTMGISSVVGRNNSFMVAAGAFLFMVSDSIIALNMFVTKISGSSFWIMLTYYIAQLLITTGSIYRSFGQKK